MAMSNSNLACDTVIRLETFAELFSLQGDKDSSQEISLRETRSEQTAIMTMMMYTREARMRRGRVCTCRPPVDHTETMESSRQYILIMRPAITSMPTYPIYRLVPGVCYVHH